MRKLYLWEKGSLEQSCTFFLKVNIFFRLTSMHQLETTLLHLTWVAWVKAKFGSMVNTSADTGRLTRLMAIAARAAMVVPIMRRNARPTVGTPARNGTSIILVWPVNPIMASLCCSHTLMLYQKNYQKEILDCFFLFFI